MKISKIVHLRDMAQRGKESMDNGTPQVIFGLATCGIAAGGMPLKEYAEMYLDENDVHADIVSVGCIGMCHAEPLVDIKLPGKPRVTYSDMDIDKLKKILDEHLVGEEPVTELAMCQLTDEISECEHGVIAETDVYDGIPKYQDLPFFAKQIRVALRNCGIVVPEDIEEYIARGGYRAAYRSLFELTPEEIIGEVKTSGIRGRGGAGFPTGLKWEFCHKAPGDVKYVICNADEGDPGAYMDRAVLEGDPHSVIEGMIIGGYAMGATDGYIYIRAEYPLAIEKLKKAIASAEEHGILGDRVFGMDYSFRIHIREGAGVFVCGEETALINSIEGKRGEPRPRPPFPAVSGLWGKPTNINNVETWANIAMILQRGGEWFSTMGTEKSTGTKVFSLVGKVNRAGLIEVPMGIPMKDIIYEIGGGIMDGRKFKAVQTGGPSGGCIPEEHLDIPVDYDNLKTLGSIVGSGGMVVLDEDTCMVDVARYFLTFTAEESCGKCTPCRIGTRRLLEILEKICHGEGVMEDLEVLTSLSEQVSASALCALGGTAPNPIMTTMKYFMNEYVDHIENKICDASVCAAMFKSPCQNTCPAGTNVPGYIQLITEGRYAEAYDVNREANPFPSICGRVCEHPCEGRCQRAQLDEPIAIRELKRYASDEAFKAGVGKISTLDDVDKTIAIVGGGPSGLSAAYFLRRMGYKPTIYEAQEKMGGWVRYGIPKYRLPHEIIDKEIQDIIDLGVVAKTNTSVGKDITMETLLNDNDAVYLAIGAQKDTKLGLEGEELPGVLPGLQLLKEMNSGKSVDLGQSILVIGGGNVAIDVARTAIRMGTKVTVCYRREEDDMPAYDEEIEHCREEGVEYHFLVAPEKLIVEGGKVVGAVFRKNVMGDFTKWGRRSPVATDETVEIRADRVVNAIGQQLDTDFAGGMNIVGDSRWIPVEGTGSSAWFPKIFAGGDAVTGPASVIDVVADGKRAARNIDLFLGGNDRLAQLEKMNNTNYSNVEPDNAEPMQRQGVKELNADDRTCGFEEVVMCMDPECAKKEASRCLRCDLSAESEGGDE